MARSIWMVCVLSVVQLAVVLSAAAPDDVPCLPAGSAVLSSWGDPTASPDRVIVHLDESIVVTRGTSVTVAGEYKGAQTEALELYSNRKLVARRDYGGKYQFIWDTAKEEGSCQLKLIEVRRTGERIIIQRANSVVLQESPLAISGLSAGLLLVDPVTIRYQAQSGYEIRNVTLYANGSPVGQLTDSRICWNVPVMPSGDYKVWLEADSSVGRIRSRTVCVSIPTRVSILKPSAGEQLAITSESKVVKLSAETHRSLAGGRIAFLCDGKKVAECAEGATETEWSAADLIPEAHQLTAQVSDKSGRTYTSAPVQVKATNQIFDQKQAENAAKQQEEWAKREKEEQARADEADRQCWLPKSTPCAQTGGVAARITFFRKGDPDYIAALQMDNGTDQPIRFNAIELIYDDYSSDIACVYEQLDTKGRPIVVNLKRIWLEPGRSLTLKLDIWSLVGAGRAPKQIEVDTNLSLFRAALP